jgi:hypothetical protein
MPLPILAIPLTVINPTTSVTKFKGSSSFLMVVQNYVERNVKKRMSLVMEAWGVSKNIISFGSRAHAFNEYLQADFKNEEGFLYRYCLTIWNKSFKYDGGKEERRIFSFTKSN